MRGDAMKKAYLILLLAALVYILPAQNSPLTLTAPNGGETWAIGSTYAITWTQMNLTGNVMLHLLGTNTNPANNLIAADIPVEDGTYDWTIPSTVTPAYGYRVRISLAANAGVSIFDISDGMFTIVGGDPPPPPPPPPTTFITVLSPNGGEVWQTGTEQTITWAYQNLEGEVEISLIQANGTQAIMVAPAVPIETGSFVWNIPVTFPTGMYKVHVMWLSTLTVYFGDLSDNFFTIEGTTPPPPPPPQQLTIISPNGGETWQAGTMHPILWNYNGNGGNVMLKLMGADNTTPPLIIAHSIPAAAGVFDWLIPPNISPGPNYLVQIILLNNTGEYIQDISDGPFTITPDPAGSIIQVVSPNGGEIWVKGTMHPIIWLTAMAAGNVELALMQPANPVPVHVIVPSMPNLGQFQWIIPPFIPPANNYRIRVRLLSPTGMFDLSDGDFSIVEGNIPPPPIPVEVTSPNGGEEWHKGNTYSITWTSGNYDGAVQIFLVRGNLHHSQRMPIARHAPNTGSYEWTIPLRIPVGANYRIAVRRIGGGFDISDDSFAILPPLTPIRVSPNPTSAGTTISLELPGSLPVSVSIYNIKGQRIRTLVENTPLSGTQNFYWDGRDSQGRQTAPGIYFARVDSGGSVSTQRILILK